MKDKSDIGIVGLAVMGENLAMNIESKGFTVSVFNRSVEKVENFLNGRAQGKSIRGASSLAEFVDQLDKPRKVMLMIKAGEPVDEMIETLLPLLDPGDLIIDGGNSHFPDSERRTKYVESKGLLYIGTGVSGGEEGALKGPSLMPGGSPGAWPLIKPIFQAIAAKVDGDSACCEWIGSGGAGHFVKMVHNGIEYGDMQLIAEIYQIMKFGLKMSNDEMHKVFSEWNEGELDSYLIEITRDILSYKNEAGEYVIDLIQDRAGQKGTGKWTGIEALEQGVPLTLVVEAVFARLLSSLKDTRVEAAKLYGINPLQIDKAAINISDLRDALYAAKIVSYAQGFMLMKQSSELNSWDLQYGDIAMVWRGGCIIRSVFLGKIKAAYETNPELENLLLDPYFVNEIKKSLAGWRKTCALAQSSGIPIPCISSGLAFFDGFISERLPANLLQAQRDYFGAHTYERIDKPAGEFFHTNWTGEGGQTAASVYNR